MCSSQLTSGQTNNTWTGVLKHLQSCLAGSPVECCVLVNCTKEEPNAKIFSQLVRIDNCQVLSSQIPDYSLIGLGPRQGHLKIIMSWFEALMMGVHKGHIDQIGMLFFSNFMWTLWWTEEVKRIIFFYLYSRVELERENNYFTSWNAAWLSQAESNLLHSSVCK